jgi:hypothetical protein
MEVDVISAVDLVELINMFKKGQMLNSARMMQTM